MAKVVVLSNPNDFANGSEFNENFQIGSLSYSTIFKY